MRVEVRRSSAEVFPVATLAPETETLRRRVVFTWQEPSAFGGFPLNLGWGVNEEIGNGREGLIALGTDNLLLIASDCVLNPWPQNSPPADISWMC
jgi:hypothetical protein